MRIGIFTDTYPPYINGVSTSILVLQHALEKLGHQVYIVTVNPKNSKYEYENEGGKILKIPGVPIHIYDYRLTSIYPIRCIKKIKKWKLDVIHSHTEFGIGTFACIISKQFKIPLVHTYHTMYEDYIHYITKGYFNYTSKKIVEYLTLFYCDKTISELIVPTKKTYDLFKTKYNVKRNIHIIPTGIEIEKFYKENIKENDIKKYKEMYGIKNKDFVIIFVGRLAEEKNIEFLLESQKEIYKKHKNIKLLIVGDGPDIEKYKKYVKKEKLEDNIIFTGKVSLDVIPFYYRIANVFATASKTETQGLTVIEAMSASITPIVINDESFKNVVIDDLNGKVFSNKKEYKNIIFNLYNDRNMLNRLSNQARLSSNEYSSKYYAERVLDVYNIAINNYKINLGILNIFKNRGDKNEKNNS